MVTIYIYLLIGRHLELSPSCIGEKPECYPLCQPEFILSGTNYSAFACIQNKILNFVLNYYIEQVTDWDDRIRTVKWVDVPNSPAGDSSTGTKTATTTPRPAKRKVVETEPEPTHTEVADSARNVELLVNAVADFSKYKCKVESISFKETLMFQTRVYE